MAENKTIKKIDAIFQEYTGKYKTVNKAWEMSPEEIISEITKSGLKGRGGAGFPTGLKWKLARAVKGDEKFIICNADEGEPGTFKDREILTKVPRKVFAGMAMCARAIGGTKGFIYLRGEYQFLVPSLEKELDFFHEKMKELNFDFSIEIKMGSGAYICGEETALIESMEGKRGEPRNKPPFPIQNGYLGKPTVVNNVETFASALAIIKVGSEEYNKLGTKDQHGSKLFSISGDTPKPGVYELELGVKLSDFVEEFGDGDTKAVQVGGVAGFCVPRKNFETAVIGEGNTTGGSIMIFNSTRSMYNVLHNYLDFFEEESCGQCTPCRIGCQQLKKGIEAVKKSEKTPQYLDQLLKLTETMQLTSKCGLGQSVANSFASIVNNFKEEMIY